MRWLIVFLPLPCADRQYPGASLALVLDLSERELAAFQLPLVGARLGIPRPGERSLLIGKLNLALVDFVRPLDDLLAGAGNGDLALAVEAHLPGGLTRVLHRESPFREFSGSSGAG